MLYVSYISIKLEEKDLKNMARFRQQIGWKHHSFIHSLIQQENDYYQKTAFTSVTSQLVWEKHWKLPVNFRVFSDGVGYLWGKAWLLRTNLLKCLSHFFAFVSQGPTLGVGETFFPLQLLWGKSLAIACSSVGFLYYLHLAHLGYVYLVRLGYLLCLRSVWASAVSFSPNQWERGRADRLCGFFHF